MFSGMADFGKQRDLKQSIGFALFWIVVQILFAVATGALLEAFMTVLLNGNTNAVWGTVLVSVLGRILIPTLIGLLTVFRKWGAGNIVNIALYVLAVLLAMSPFAILNIVVFVLLAKRPGGKSLTTAPIFVPLLLLILPVALVIYAGFAASKATVELGTINANFDAKQHNLNRSLDLNTILSAVHLYAIDNNGSPIDKIPETDIEICRLHSPDCNGMLDLAALLKDYPIPVDQSETANSKGTGYAIRKTKDPKAQDYLHGYTITVTALKAEGGEKVTATR